MSEREAFELKISMEYEQPPCIDRDGDGYADGYVDNAWWGWQAALASISQEPVYFVLENKDVGSWIKVNKESFDRETYENGKLILYTSPQPNLQNAKRLRYCFDRVNSALAKPMLSYEEWLLGIDKAMKVKG
jgi:hypothetical protein